MNVNYFTPTVMIRKLESLLLGRHIAVVVSMMAIIEGGIHVASYSASKHALYGYLASLRQEYKKFGKNISVSIGCPYAINTTMFKGFKTKLDYVVRILDETYCAHRLVKEFVERKDVCFMYLYEALFFRLLSFMPTQLIDFAAVHLDVSRYTPNKNQ
jgi:short-subunit dehydrogenase